ncbi:hypothetical protein D9M68_960080 [compost metagenome]
MAAITLDHPRQRQACQVQDRPQVDVDQQVDAFGVRLENRARFIDTGVVHQNVELLGFEQTGQPGQISDIDGVCDTACLGRQVLQLVGAAGQCVYLHAFLTQAFDDGGADPGRSTGHQRGFVI